MSRQLIVTCGLWIAATGCVTHRAIQLDPPSRLAIRELAAEVGEKSARIDFVGGSTPQAIDVRFGADSIRWRTRDGRRYAVRPARILAIEVKARGRGAFEGMLGGVAAAALAGGIAGICCEATNGVWIPTEYAVGVGAAVVTIPIGALVGFVRGHRIIYEPGGGGPSGSAPGLGRPERPPHPGWDGGRR